MSKTRFDRNKAARAQHWDASYAALTGGIDQASSPLNMKPGRLQRGLNVEENFGQQGYSFVLGYERFDGRSAPSQADYSLQRFHLGTVAIAAGNTVTNATTASGLVVSVTVDVGSFAGGDAEGVLLLTNVTGAWADGDPIKVGGVQRATAADITESGSAAYADNQTAMTTVREYLRALIAKPPGEGAILGGAVFNGVVYCVRNIVGSATATLWKSSASGWQSVKTGLHPSGAYKFEAANFSGASDDLSLYFVSGRTRLGKVTVDDVVTFAAPIWGSEATSTTAVTIGLGAKTLTIAESARDWVVGSALTVWDVADRANYMVGTVTAYNSGTGQLDMNITVIGGVGTLSNWEIGRTDYTDKPFLLTEHKNHMWLAYQQGQLQTSNLGDPMAATTTAALFGLGQDIHALISLKGKALGVFCESKVDVIDGSSATDWNKTTYSQTVGAIAETVQENSGNAMMLTRRGLTTLQSTDAFGDFESAIFSRDVQKTLEVYRNRVVGSRMARNNYQYRLYFDDGTNLRFTLLSGSPTPKPRDVSPSLSTYNHIPSCTFSGVMADGKDRMFFGTEDGWLMEEDAGSSFDGTAIYYAAMLAYDHFKSPAMDKQFHKLELELSCQDPLTINFRMLFDYDDGTFDFGGGTAVLAGEGGLYDSGTFDQIYFDRPGLSRQESGIDGQGRNMALLIWAESDFVRPATLQGVMTFFTKLSVRP